MIYICVFRYIDVYNSDWTGSTVPVGKEFSPQALTAQVRFFYWYYVVSFLMGVLAFRSFWWVDIGGFLFEPVNFQVEVPIFFWPCLPDIFRFAKNCEWVHA